MGKPELYRPSNGSEGCFFMDCWCAKCERHDFNDDDKEPCEILGRTMYLHEDDPNYPTEWQYKDGQPVCTAFVQGGD